MIYKFTDFENQVVFHYHLMEFVLKNLEMIVLLLIEEYLNKQELFVNLLLVQQLYNKTNQIFLFVEIILYIHSGTIGFRSVIIDE